MPEVEVSTGNILHSRSVLATYLAEETGGFGAVISRNLRLVILRSMVLQGRSTAGQGEDKLSSYGLQVGSTGITILCL